MPSVRMEYKGCELFAKVDNSTTIKRIYDAYKSRYYRSCRNDCNVYYNDEELNLESTIGDNRIPDNATLILKEK